MDKLQKRKTRSPSLESSKGKINLRRRGYSKCPGCKGGLRPHLLGKLDSGLVAAPKAGYAHSLKGLSCMLIPSGRQDNVPNTSSPRHGGVYLSQFGLSSAQFWGGLQPCWLSGCKPSSQTKSSTKWLDHGGQGVEEWELPWKSTTVQRRLSVGKKQCFKGPGKAFQQADLKALQPLETANITSQAGNCCLGDR